MRAALVVLSVWMLPGCASQVQKLVGDLNSEEPCCTSYSEFVYQRIPLDGEFLFTVGPGDRAFLFPSGKSYFKGFELPPVDGNYSIEIRTYLVGEWIPTSHVFGPLLDFLDADNRPLQQAVFPRMHWDEGFFEGSRWTGAVRIPPTAKYVIVYTTPELINTRIALGTTSGYAYATATGVVFVPPSGERSASYGPAGKLRLRFLMNVH